MTQAEVFHILGEYKSQMKQMLSVNLEKIILFGSYARGDYHEDSDIDLMILLHIPGEEICNYTDGIYEKTYDIEEKYSVEINPCIQSSEVYMKWKKVYPFFVNIEKEGVSV